MKALWLDDLRDPTSGMWSDRIDPALEVVWVKSRDEFETAFEDLVAEGTLASIHFDNDLGIHNEPDRGQEGRHCFTWLEEQCRTRNLGPFSLYAHTANPAARRELRGGFASLGRFWASDDFKENI